jgi:hypothetical protein
MGMMLPMITIRTSILTTVGRFFSDISTSSPQSVGYFLSSRPSSALQERLKNATGKLSEKIGNMLLPTLASLTEAFIPIVDKFGEGVDAIQAWVTEVGKMPEV